eukprot:12900053-Prorocentrum_lima.AAC.1
MHNTSVAKHLAAASFSASAGVSMPGFAAKTSSVTRTSRSNTSRKSAMLFPSFIMWERKALSAVLGSGTVARAVWGRSVAFARPSSLRKRSSRKM